MLARWRAPVLKISGISSGFSAPFATDNNVPIWARSGVNTMCTLGVFDNDDSSSLSEKITRGDVADYLLKIAMMLKK